MYRGWAATLKDGRVLREDTVEWIDVPKRDIIKLSLIYDKKRWDIENKQAYFIKTRVSVVPGNNDSFRVEKRMVGWYEGKDKLAYVIDEHTGSCKIEVL